MNGDYALEDTVYIPFTTRAFATGIPTALASGEVQVYEDASVTQITAAETLTVSIDSVAGFNMCSVAATSANGFESGKSYTCILAAGTVGGVSVVGEVVGQFTIEASAAAVDLANGTDGLGAIKAQTAAIETDTQDLQTQVGTAGAGLTNIGTIATVTNLTNLPSIPANWITTAGITDGAYTAAKFAASSLDGKGDWNTVVPDAAGVAATEAEVAVLTGITDALIVALNDPSAATIADAVWDEAATGHTDAGKAGQQLWTDIDAILVDTGTTLDGKIDTIGTDTAATQVLAAGATGFAAIDTVVDAILVDTGEIGAAGAGLTNINLPNQTMDITGDITGNLSGSVGSVAGNVDGNVTGSVGSNLELGPAEVNAEVDTALATTTYAEPSGVPAATATLKDKIGYLYMALRNRVDVTATKKTFYDDADAAEWEKDLTDNDTTYSESEGNAI